MSANAPLIEPDAEETLPPPVTQSRPPQNLSSASQPSNQTPSTTDISAILRSSSHPLILLLLYAFRLLPLLTYILSGLFTGNYVLSTVLVVVLLSVDFYNLRNVAGRMLVGLRFWNQVDDDGESYWVFESRDPSRGSVNKVDDRMFWIALYTFPVLWSILLIISLLKFNLQFVPTVILALVFNYTNAIGFTYADRDAKQRWANNLSSSFGLGGLGSLGSMGSSVVMGAVRSGMGRVFK